MYESISLLATGLTIGFIIFQVGINTSVIFTKLSPESASVVLRTIFPRFFLSIFFFSLVSFISLYFSENEGFVVSISIATIFLAGTCYFLIPATNNARDTGNERLFSIYHNISVFSTLLILIINLISFFSYQVHHG